MVQLTEGAILCTVDFVGLYPNMPHEEGLASLRKFLDANFSFIRTETETLLKLAEIVLKNNIFQFNERTLKQLRGTAIGTNLPTICNFIYGWPFEVRILEDNEPQPRIWWRYIDDIFFNCGHGEDSFKQFIEILYACQSKTKK